MLCYCVSFQEEEIGVLVINTFYDVIVFGITSYHVIISRITSYDVTIRWITSYEVIIVVIVD